MVLLLGDDLDAHQNEEPSQQPSLTSSNTHLGRDLEILVDMTIFFSNAFETLRFGLCPGLFLTDQTFSECALQCCSLHMF